MRKASLMASTAAAAILMSGTASATTFEKTVTTQQQYRPETVYIDFMAFDANRDGVLSRSEIGETLFYIFDTDGNEVIDNIEINNEKIYTMSPIVEETVVKVDFDDDGRADMAEVTYDTFMDRSRLARFGAEGDKMSAREFIGDSFLELDIDDSKVVELDEWKDAYVRSLAPLNANQDLYNR